MHRRVNGDGKAKEGKGLKGEEGKLGVSGGKESGKVSFKKGKGFRDDDEDGEREEKGGTHKRSFRPGRKDEESEEWDEEEEEDGPELVGREAKGGVARREEDLRRKGGEREGREGEEEMDAEQRRLAEEMERRRRRVQEWQEQRRKKAEEEQARAAAGAGGEGGSGGAGGSSAAQAGGEGKGRGWTLDGESDDEEEKGAAGDMEGKEGKGGKGKGKEKVEEEGEGEEGRGMDLDEGGEGEKGEDEEEGEKQKRDLKGKGKEEEEAAKEEAAEEEEEVDPLDAFMNSLVLPEVAKLDAKDATRPAAPTGSTEPAVGGSSSSHAANGGDALMGAGAVVGADKGGAKGKKEKEKEKEKGKAEGKRKGKGPKGRMVFGVDSESEDEGGGAGESGDEEGEGEEGGEGGKKGEEEDAEFVKRVTAVAQTKAEKLAPVDHSQVHYEPFRKNFYKEVKEVAKMTADEVALYRREHEFKLRGKDVPKPVHTWVQSGLSNKVLDVLKKMGFERPMPIQAQALPIVMSGRDCIGIAKTGSGKTLAFVLPMLRHIMDQTGSGKTLALVLPMPMLRHIMDQPPLQSGDGPIGLILAPRRELVQQILTDMRRSAPLLGSGDGPIGLILAPTRELVQQIFADIRRFARPLGLSCVPVYGGSGVAQQISELKRGAEVVVCTPGRMIDILATSNGRITNLRRVTYLVLDEADRMFDMGFEPQIGRIIGNTRPDRQTVLFSATFPRQVETLARKVLTKPIEIQVGGRSVVNSDITQTVEVRPEGEQRFLRLLELLGEWCDKGKILVFVHSQDKCDALFRDLLKSGYPCLSLHGAKDQTDRESTLQDFKTNVCNLLVATSVAARGLDVKELELVINYDVPNHYEDYVHRVGRTGRAGRKGCAVTFISPEEDRFAPDLVRALELSKQPIPEDLKAMADAFTAKVKAGSVVAHGSGYGGSGFKFNEEEEAAKKALKKAQAKEYGVVVDEEEGGEEEEEKEEKEGSGAIRRVEATSAGGAAASAAQSIAAAVAAAAAAAAANKAGGAVPAVAGAAAANPIQAAVQARMAQMGITPAAGSAGAAGATAAAAALANPLAASLVGAAAAGESAATAIASAAAAAPTPVSRAAAFAAAISLQHNLAKLQPAEPVKAHYEAEFEINEFPQHARWKITHKETLNQIIEWTGASVTTRGLYCPPGKALAAGEKKLYLSIEGPTEASVKKAKVEIKRIIEEASAADASHQQRPVQPGRYSVM
ncbi:unnamed protein product [Closterium sp. NIES-64]|nr:unnamed protein product [Closterium sp. NIES-64]